MDQHTPVNRAERIRRRAFLSRDARRFARLQALAAEAHTIRDVPPS